ncbi:MAG: ABC transporter substrate-binding protein [Pseudomonadota bacterium]
MINLSWTIEKKAVCQKLLLAAFLLLLVVFPVASHAGDEAIEQMRSSIDRILAVLRRGEVVGENWEDKKKEVAAIVRDRCDSRELAQRVLAQHWKALKTEQREHFAVLFADVLETTYINKLKSYSDEDIAFKKQLVKGDKAFVYSVVLSKNQEIPVDYRLLKNGDEWLIYDIIIEGVSLVQNYRKQFDQIIKNEKYEGLILRMEEKIKENRQKDREADA